MAKIDFFRSKKSIFGPQKSIFGIFSIFRKFRFFRRCRPRQKMILRFWPFFRGQCAKTVGRIGASLGSFWRARKTLQNEPKIVKNGFLVFAQWGSRKPDFHFFKKTRFSALFFGVQIGRNRPKMDFSGRNFAIFDFFAKFWPFWVSLVKIDFFDFWPIWDPPDRSRQNALFEKWPVLAQKRSDFKNIFLGTH